MVHGRQRTTRRTRRLSIDPFADARRAYANIIRARWSSPMRTLSEAEKGALEAKLLKR
jgi:hypothetical protein